MKKFTVGILQFNPQTLWRRGGGEIHAEKYIEFGNNEQFEVERFDWSNPKKYDLIHLFGANHHLNDFGKYAQAEGIKVVITPILWPGGNFLKYKVLLAINKYFPFPDTLRLRKELLSQADLLIANTKIEKKYLNDVYEVESSKIAVYGSGVDAKWLNPAENENPIFEEYTIPEKYFLMVGRVTPLKNQLDVVKTFMATNHHLVIVGLADNEAKSYIYEIEYHLKKAKNITWIKGLPEGSNALASLYGSSQAHILFSDTDVAPLVNMEAAACRTIVISKPHVTVMEIMRGNMFAANDEAGLKTSLDLVANLDAKARESMLDKAYNLVKENHQWEYIVKSSLDLYSTILIDNNDREKV